MRFLVSWCMNAKGNDYIEAINARQARKIAKETLLEKKRVKNAYEYCFGIDKVHKEAKT